MKKILILMSLLLALSGCLSKKIAWEDVSARYDEIYNEAISEAAAYDSYSISDFKNLFAAVCDKPKAVIIRTSGLGVLPRFRKKGASGFVSCQSALSGTYEKP